MLETPEALQFEIRRLRDIVERQYLELAWQQSELRSRGGKAKIVRFNGGNLARSNLTGNAGLLRQAIVQPPSDAWPVGTIPARALIPNCGYASYASSRDEIGAIGIAVCGLDEQTVEHVTGMVEERLRRARNFRPVFLMDITRTEIFRRRGLAYEYIAPCDEKEKRLAGSLVAFNAQRVEFLKLKWGFSGIINFGKRRADNEIFKSGHSPRGRNQLAVNSAVDEMIGQSAGKRMAKSTGRAA
jgi:hypothetical protein